MKKNTLLVALMFLAAVVFGQENEQAPEKGQLFNNSNSEMGFQYYTPTGKTAPSLKLETWQNTGWKKSANQAGMFSTGTYGNNANYRMVSPVFELPKLTSQSERLNLYIDEQFELESYYDEGLVSVSTDGGKTWNTLSARSGKGQRSKSIVNLTAYNGKKIQLAFSLVTDIANTFSGWDIFGAELKLEKIAGTYVRAMKKNSGALQGEITSLDAQKFPRFVFAHFDLDHNGAPVGDVNNSHVTGVVETIDGVDYPVKKDDTFNVYAPDNATVKRPVNIVFLMDNSGSMREEKEAVAANVVDFVDKLSNMGFEYRLALCRFGQSQDNGIPLFHNNAGWYSDPEEFKSVWKSANVVGGSREPSWDALVESTQRYPFQNGAQKIFILITDENITGNNNNLQYCKVKDKQVVINTLKDAGITMHAVVSPGSDFNKDFGEIATGTNGKQFNITSSFNDILNTITEQINNRYTVRYTPTNPVFDGKERLVKLEISYGGDQLTTATQSYTPGKSPVIIRTDKTLALHKKGQEQRQDIIIEVRSEDAVAPYTTSVSLFYRLANSLDPFKEVAMSGTSGAIQSLWSGIIPASDVLPDGIEYYLKATDGESTVSVPEATTSDIGIWSFAVLPNQPPVIKNVTQIANLTVGNNATITAEASDNTNFLTEVAVHVRENADITYKKHIMTFVGGKYEYSFTLGEGITDYYLTAKDDLGIESQAGTASRPYFIVSDVPWAITPTQETHKMTIWDFDFSQNPPIWETKTEMGMKDLDSQDMVGAFYTDNSTEKCAGFFIKGSAPRAFFIYGDDPATPEKDGFAIGEKIKFKIFKADDKITYDAEHSFKSGPEVFTADGESSVESVYAFYSQQITLPKGTFLWSTYLEPKDLNFDNIISNNNTNIKEINDDKENSWVPGGASNTLTQYSIGYGFEVFSKAKDSIIIQGGKLSLNQVRVKLIGDQKKTLIGCPYESTENVENVFPVDPNNNVYAVDKYLNDGQGNITIETFSPKYNINRWVDKNVHPGEAYYVFAQLPDDHFSFPAPSGPYPTKKDGLVQQNIKQTVRSIEKYMHIVVPANANKSLAAGNELRAYNTAGNLIGRANTNPQGTTLILDGFSTQNEEAFELRLWSAASNTEHAMEVSEWAIGNGTYANHKLAVVGKLQIDESAASELHISTYPVPTVDLLNIRFNAEQGLQTQISLSNIYGQVVLKQQVESHSGENKVELPVSELESGVYHLTVKQDKHIRTTKVVIKK